VSFAGGDENLYNYVGGNSPNLIDPTGNYWWVPVIGAAAGGAANAWGNYDAYNSGKFTAGQYWGSIGYGAVFGAVSSIVKGVGSVVFVGGTLNGVNDVLNQKQSRCGKKVDWKKAGLESFVGGFGGGASKIIAAKGMSKLISTSIQAAAINSSGIGAKATALAESFLSTLSQFATNIYDGYKRRVRQ